MVLLEANRNNPREGGPSFSWGHRIGRFLWLIVWGGLGRWTPTPMHGWRRTLLRCFGADLAKSAKIYPGVDIWLPRNLSMDAFATIGPGVNCYCMSKVSLGRHALVSQGATLCCGTHDIDDPHLQLVVAPIHVAAEAWIAAEAFVGPGVTVGEGAVLGARGVQFRNMEPWTVYAGNPAKAIRKRRNHQFSVSPTYV